MSVSAPSAAPLAWLTQVSRRVYLYRPSATAALAPLPAPASSPAPELILLSTWMGAAASHIQKYAEPYRKLYPQSSILIVRSEPSDFFWPRTASEEVNTAADIVRASFPDLCGGAAAVSSDDSAPTSVSSSITTLAPASPKLLIHVWSNGGNTMLARIRAQLPRLPAYTLVLDSTPGLFRYKATYTAFSLTAPNGWLRRLLAPALHALCTLFWTLSIRDKVLAWFARRRGTPRVPRGPLERSAASLNKPKWLGTEVRRTYIYSDTDALIAYKDVERNIRDAEKAGFAVRREMFKGSAHVAHARSDPKRYWTIARETWSGPEAEIKAVEPAQPETFSIEVPATEVTSVAVEVDTAEVDTAAEAVSEATTEGEPSAADEKPADAEKVPAQVAA